MTTKVKVNTGRVLELHDLANETRQAITEVAPQILKQEGVDRALMLVTAGQRLIDEIDWVCVTFEVEHDEDVKLVNALIEEYGKLVANLMSGPLVTLLELMDGNDEDDEEEA